MKPSSCQLRSKASGVDIRCIAKGSEDLAWSRAITPNSPGPSLLSEFPRMPQRWRITFCIPREAFLHGVAGAIASGISMLLLYPLDLVRVVRQLRPQDRLGFHWHRCPFLGQAVGTFLELLAGGGLVGLYRGMLATLQTLMISYFVYFFLYNWLKSLFIQMRGLETKNGRPASANVISQSTSLGDMCASALGGVLNVLLTSPFWVAAMRLKFASSHRESRGRGLLEEISYIVDTEGIAALWCGLASSLMLVSNPIIHFVIYDALKRTRLRLRATGKADVSLTARDAFLVGAISKALATLATYPLQVAQSLQRSGQFAGDLGVRASSKTFTTLPKELPIYRLLFELVRKDGFCSLFAGLETKFLQTVLNAALMFMFYERIASLLFHFGVRSRSAESASNAKDV